MSEQQEPLSPETIWNKCKWRYALPNGLTTNWAIGIDILKGATDTRIGTDSNGVADAIERNVISGNKGWGIHLSNYRWGVASPTPTERTTIAGNYIGLNAAGDAAMPNGFIGVLIHEGGFQQRRWWKQCAGRNVISGIRSLRSRFKMLVRTTILSRVTISVQTQLEWSLFRTVTLACSSRCGASNTRVGTNGDGVDDLEERNVIGGHSAGAYLSKLQRQGRWSLATMSVSMQAVLLHYHWFKRQEPALRFMQGQTNTRIGTDGSNDPFNINERNVIGGGAWHGVVVSGVGTTNTSIAGNYIGTDATGTAAIGNGQESQSGMVPAVFASAPIPMELLTKPNAM